MVCKVFCTSLLFYLLLYLLVHLQRISLLATLCTSLLATLLTSLLGILLAAAGQPAVSSGGGDTEQQFG